MTTSQMRIGALAIVTALMASTALPLVNAQTQEGTVTIYGSGTASCGTWVSDEKEPTKLLRFQDTGWVMGFVTAVGWQGGKIRKTDSAAIIAWMDNYCSANPLKGIYEAAEALAVELGKPSN